MVAYGDFPLYFSTDLYKLFTGVVANGPQFYLYVFLTPLACVLPDFFARSLQRQLAPTDDDIVREVQKREAASHVSEASQGSIWARAAGLLAASAAKRAARRSASGRSAGVGEAYAAPPAAAGGGGAGGGGAGGAGPPGGDAFFQPARSPVLESRLHSEGGDTEAGSGSSRLGFWLGRLRGGGGSGSDAAGSAAGGSADGSGTSRLGGLLRHRSGGSGAVAADAGPAGGVLWHANTIALVDPGLSRQQGQGGPLGRRSHGISAEASAASGLTVVASGAPMA